jgi:hypothetical protein
MDTLIIYRGTDPFWTIKLENDSNQSKIAMGENVINIHFFLSVHVPFNIGDWCTVFGEVYKLNELPILKKTASNLFEYTLKLQHEGFDLSKAQYFFFGPDNTLIESEFTLHGNAETFIDLLIQNINRVSSGWSKGSVVSSAYKTLTFSKENCYNVLGRLAEEFGTEYWIEGKAINLIKKARDTGLTLQVGYNRGLYEINRVNIDSTRVITRIYPYGSDKNLPSTYTGTRLHLPPKPSHGNDCLISDITWFYKIKTVLSLNILQINWRPPADSGVTSIEMVSGNVGAGVFPNSVTFPVNGPAFISVLSNYSFDAKFISRGGACDGQETSVVTITGESFQPVFPFVPVIYLDKNVDLYRVIEDVVYFDDIYPHRTGIVTSIDAADPFKIIDTAIDFDLNSYFLPGLTAKITFNTGQLAGFTFDISSYNNTTKTIVFLQNKNEPSLIVPSSLIKAGIGDEYVITDIRMPDAYIEAAEAQLLFRAQEVLRTYSEPQYTIQAVPDTIYMKNYGRELFVGDTVWIKDDQLQIDRKIRITQVIRNLIEPYEFQITLSDVVTVGRMDSISSSISTNQRDVSQLGTTVQTRDVFNGQMVLPASPGGAGFENVIVEISTNKLYRKE